MNIRPRILRKNEGVRALVQETQLQMSDFIAPLFIVEGEGVVEEISSLPNYFRLSLDETLKEVAHLCHLGVKAFILFVKCESHLKDNKGTEALNENGLMQRSIKTIKKHFPEVVVFSDVALDPYSNFGHDGIVQGKEILNDESVAILSKMALSHAKAGVDFVAPSDMMDGRIASLRKILEENNFTDVGIMSYTAKYASCFYGPFRDALDSAPGFGDKKSYQMNPANREEAIKELELDSAEGADIIMVKPAMAYLDVIRELKDRSNLPISAYQVSGEYAMIKAAAQNNWLDEDAAIYESLIAIKRAGASLIVSYFVKDIAKILNKK